ncbi:hypothetical protein T4E_11271 [Trichinella pseudospiralis]|uniref:Uncharacterized protein n=1 Tax=Trichinella pseudospiralis TaxID=6337 RepID=A0A0V0XLQ9_TRIPS|nr:hypothetical protein T4E_11271 [Trichinella pseudospiralis]
MPYRFSEHRISHLVSVHPPALLPHWTNTLESVEKEEKATRQFVEWDAYEHLFPD